MKEYYIKAKNVFNGKIMTTRKLLDVITAKKVRRAFELSKPNYQGIVITEFYEIN